MFAKVKMDKDLEFLLSYYCLVMGSPESYLMNFSRLSLVSNVNKVSYAYHIRF